MNSWDEWVELALQKLESHKLLRSVRPIHLSKDSNSLSHSNADDFEFFDELRQWDRDTVEVQISETTYHKWLQDIPSSGAGYFYSISFFFFSFFFDFNFSLLLLVVSLAKSFVFLLLNLEITT